MTATRTCTWAIWCSSQAGPELIIWDQEGSDLDKLRSDANAAIAGGKSRLIPGFDYGPDGAVRATYQVAGARMTRPDGRKPFIPDYADNKTPRPNLKKAPDVTGWEGGQSVPMRLPRDFWLHRGTLLLGPIGPACALR